METIESGDYVSTIAEADGLTVGFTMVQISEGHVFACFVRPAFEGRGLGRAFVDAADAACAAPGVTRTVAVDEIGRASAGSQLVSATRMAGGRPR